MIIENIIPHKHKTSKKERNELTGNKSPVIWLTGLSGSGKSTLAGELELKLHEKGILTYVLDGDNVRMGLNRDLGFSDKDRKENIRRVGEVAKLMSDAGIVVITAFISPFREDRNTVRELIGNGEFIEVYVKCSVKICEERDVKGLYKKAREGNISDFTGIDSGYEEPEDPEIIVDTTNKTIDESVKQLMNFIESKLTLKSNIGKL